LKKQNRNRKKKQKKEETNWAAAHWPRVVRVVRHLRSAPLEAGYKSTRLGSQ
jgi:hypothetical protein